MRGQYHGHPYGELNLVVPLNKGAELKGLQGWQGPGWTAPDPGSRHYPEVRGGAVIALFYLPAGRISYDFKPPPDHRTAHLEQRYPRATRVELSDHALGRQPSRHAATTADRFRDVMGVCC